MCLPGGPDARQVRAEPSAAPAALREMERCRHRAALRAVILQLLQQCKIPVSATGEKCRICSSSALGRLLQGLARGPVGAGDKGQWECRLA